MVTTVTTWFNYRAATWYNRAAAWYNRAATWYNRAAAWYNRAPTRYNRRAATTVSGLLKVLHNVGIS